MNTLIETKKEAKIAAEIAAKNGFAFFTPERMYRRKLKNIFKAWPMLSLDTQAEIASAIKSSRDTKSTSKSE
jgi:hypothetical protein